MLHRPWRFTSPVGGGGSLPTVTSLGVTQGDTLGGELVPINGTNFTGTTGVTIGGSICPSFTVISATLIYATAPAHAAATGQSVVVTNASGANGANALYEFWAPSELTLTGFWERGDYLPGTWTARASAGVSAGRDAVQVTAANQPAETNLEPICAATRFLTNALALSNFITGTAYGIAIVFNAASAAADGVSFDVTTSLIQDSGGNWGVNYSTSGVRGWHYSGGQIGIAVPAATNAEHVAIVRYNGTSIFVSVDGGAESSVAIGSLLGLTGTLRIGTDSGATHGVDATIRSVALINADLAPAIRTKILKWAQARHGVST